MTIDLSSGRDHVVRSFVDLLHPNQENCNVHLIVSRPIDNRLVGDENLIARAFETLCQMPNLTHLKLDFGHFVTLPLVALTGLLQHKKNLEQLEFHGLELSGTASAGMKALQKVLVDYFPLQSLHFADCRGTVALQTFVEALPCLKVLRLTHMPDITDLQMVHLVSSDAAAIERLEGLHLKSTAMTGVTGYALQRVLVKNNNEANLKSLTLGLDWGDCANILADLLSGLPRLQEADFTCYSDHRTSDYLQVFQGIGQQLKSLSLTIETEPGSSKRIKKRVLYQALEDLLETNVNLGRLQLCNGVKELRIPATVKTKLRLNRCGASTLLRQPDGVHSAAFLKTLIAQKDKIDITFALLSANPAICQHGIQGAANTNSALTDKDEQEVISSIFSQSPVKGKADGVKSSKTASAYIAKMMQLGKPTKKGIGKKVKSIFARSA